MRIIALDVHRSFAQTAILGNGKLRDAGKIDLEYSRLLRFARKLKLDDEIVIEATGNTSAIVRVLLPFVGRVVIANPILVRAIAWAKSRPIRSTRRSWRSSMRADFCPKCGCRTKRLRRVVASWLNERSLSRR